MSFDENVARKKSTRWVKASQANYDGDDWSDDDYYGEGGEHQQPPVPKLPELPDEYTATTQQRDEDEYSYGTAPTPDINTKKFQEIDIDAEEEAQVPSVIPTEQLSVDDDYAQIIQDDEDDDDEYTPQTSSRFQPFPDQEPDAEKVQEDSAPESLEKEVSQTEYSQPEEQPLQEEEEVPYDSNVPTSFFMAFPTEFDQMIPNGDVEASDEVVQREPESTPTEAEEKGSHLGNPSITQNRLSLQSHADSIGEARSPVASDINYSDDDEEEEYVPKTSHFQSELSEEEEDKTENLNQLPEGSWRSPIDIDDESDDEAYVPRTSHFQSQLSDEDLEENHGDNEHEDADENDPSEHLQNLILRDVTPEAKSATQQDIPTIIEPSSLSTNDMTINIAKANTQLNPPPLSPAPYELSDADTLHIHDPMSSPETEEQYMEPTVRETSPVDASMDSANYEDDGFNEHAYLAGLVSTPKPEDFEVQQFEPEEEDEEKTTEEEPVRDALKPSRESQFYNSMSDYYDDYTDESGANKDDLGITRTHSSGSLSTGGFSIRSETGGYRSSKMSDRTASFTGERTQSFTNQSISDADGNAGAEKESQLNPAMSINFGHWRPNTESYRDQFISGSGTPTVPPLPKIDNYARNSRGEIIEDNASMAESIAVSHMSNGSDLKKQISVSSSVNDGEHNTSMLSVLEDEDEDESPARLESKDLKYGTTYKTDSDSMLPVHIPLSSPSDVNTTTTGQYFHENLTSSETTFQTDSTPKVIPTRKPASYNMKKISTLDNPELRIKKYREAREEEANLSTGLEIWISQAIDKVEMESYKSPVTSHVKQAYAEASQFSKKHTNINMGSFLNRRKVIQETSSGAQSIAKGAKGIFSMGRRMMKSSDKS